MMKKIYYAIIAAAIITACQPDIKTLPFDQVAAKADLTKTLDTMYLAYNTKDIKIFLSLMADDGLYCGTDPAELWDKATYSERMTEMFADSSFSPGIIPGRREIRFEKDGNSAMVVDQFYFEWNKKIPIRHIAHFNHSANKWTCNFLSTTLIPENKDLDKIFSSVK